MFIAHDRKVGFGVNPLDSSEPSTPFGRVVRDALEVFKVYKLPQGQHGTLEIAHWKKPAEYAANTLTSRSFLPGFGRSASKSKSAFS